LIPKRFKWSSDEEAMWDLLLDDDANGNMNRYHLLGNHFNQIGMACNCNPVYG
jgi:hypothetical protein